eukprot:6601929-Prorocentrum_lima.AAC.1
MASWRTSRTMPVLRCWGALCEGAGVETWPHAKSLSTSCPFSRWPLADWKLALELASSKPMCS